MVCGSADRAVVLGGGLFWLYHPANLKMVSEPPDSYSQIEGATLIVEQEGKQIGEESFSLDHGQKSGWFKLSSHATLRLPPTNDPVELTQLLILSPTLQPVAHTLDLLDAGQKLQWTTLLDAKNHMAEMVGTIGLFPPVHKSISFDKEPFVFDGSLISPYFVLFEMLKRLGVDALDLTAIVPKRLTSWPLKVNRTVNIALSTASGEIQAERYEVQAGDIGRVELYVHGDQLVGVRIVDKDRLVYRSDLFPQGFGLAETPSSPTLPAGIVDAAVQFASAGLKLGGSLALPQSPGNRLPAVLMIAGAGPVDRDENPVGGGKLNVFNQIAYYLAQQGIASLRYDKCGVGESQGDFETASMDDLVQDAQSALAYLKTRPEIDPARVFLLGHSEGGVLAPILAAEAQVAGLIVIAGPARPLDQALLWDQENELRANGVQGLPLQRELEKQRQFIAFVKQSQGEWSDYTFEQAKAAIPLLANEQEWKDWQSAGALSWYRQHFQHDPLETIRRVHASVLILQGTKDLFLSPEDPQRLAAALRDAGNTQVTVAVLPDLNHVLRYQPEDANSGYFHVDQPVDERLLKSVASWISQLSVLPLREGAAIQHTVLTRSQASALNSIGLKRVAEGLTAPVALASAEDGTGRLFIVDQIGLIRILAADGKLLDDPFLDIRERMLRLNPAYDERGFLGLAFHPDFKQNGRFFVYYSAPLRPGGTPGALHTNYISEFKVSADNPNQADPNSERVLLSLDYVPRPGDDAVFHQGGQLAFGPDGYLYVALGDGDHPENGQNLDTLLGKILRIDVDHGNPYGILPDNPFVSRGGRGEIFAYGFRNPYRFSFDTGGTHSLFVADVGEDRREEVDIVTKGSNYGWPIKEGTLCFMPPTGCLSTGARGEPLIDPIIEYDHSVGRAVIGGFVYRGMALPEFAGRYIFGNWVTSSSPPPDGKLFVATPPPSVGATWPMEELRIATSSDGTLGQRFVLALGQDSDHELYVLTTSNIGPTGNTGEVFKIIPAP
jgi:glucose/arabinose dehydrogenase/alpha-beta hydrolase superfamily lysophospholipase